MRTYVQSWYLGVIASNLHNMTNQVYWWNSSLLWHLLHHVMGSNNLNSLSVAHTYKLRPFGPIIPSKLVVYTCIIYMWTVLSSIYIRLSPITTNMWAITRRMCMLHLVLNGAQVSCERNVPASGRHSVYSRPSDITATKVHRPALNRSQVCRSHT